MKQSLIGAVTGAVIGVLLALALFCAGPQMIEWIKGPRLETEAWVFYVITICGAGFGAVTGAIVGTTRTRS